MSDDSATEAIAAPARVSVEHPPRASERALIREAARGSQEAAEQLARAHWDDAHRAAYLITRDRGAAEDIAQEAILAALGSLGRFDLKRSFRPWLHRIVANRAIDWLRSRERRGEVWLDQAPAAPSAELDAAGVLFDRLTELDPQTRAIVVLRCVFDYRPREIASMVGLSSGAVRTRLHRALGDLRRTIEEESDD